MFTGMKTSWILSQSLDFLSPDSWGFYVATEENKPGEDTHVSPFTAEQLVFTLSSSTGAWIGLHLESCLMLLWSGQQVSL